MGCVRTMDIVVLLLLSAGAGATFFGLYQTVLKAPLVAVSSALCGIKDVSAIEDDKEKLKLFRKVPVFLVKVTVSTILWFSWLSFASQGSHQGWSDISSWSDMDNGYLRYMEDSLPETDAAKRVYLAYFAYVIFVFLQDLNATSDQKPLVQLTFTLHHVVTIILVSGSLYHGVWRVGVLFRIIHDPTDMVLYSCKIYETYMKIQGYPHRSLVPPMLLVLVAWVVTRILIFGWFCWCVFLFRLGPCTTDPNLVPVLSSTTCLTAGVGIMLVLQIIWLLGLCDILTKTIKKGKMVDTNHGD